MSSTDFFSLEDGILKNYFGPGGDIVIPDGTRVLTSRFCFKNCANIRSIHIPASVKVIDSGVLSSCPDLQNIYVDSGNDCFISLEGVLFNITMTELLCFPAGRSGDYAIPSGVIKIGWSAFYGCSRLTSVEFPDTIREIGGCAFCDCSSVKELILPHSVEIIEQDAFRGWDSLETVIIPGNVEKLGEYGNDAISGKSLKAIDVDSDNKKYFSTDGMLFTGKGKYLQFCPSAKEGPVHLPNNLVGINANAFCGCCEITEVILPETIKKVGYGAFCDCKNLKEIHIPDEIQILAESTFEGCVNLEKVQLSKRLAKIGSNVFKDCYSLKRINLPKTLVSIGKDAFPESIALVCYPETFAKLNKLAKTRTAMEYLKDSSGFEEEQASAVKAFIISSGNKLLKVIIEEGYVEALMGYASLVPLTEKDITAAISVSIKSNKPLITAELLEMKNKLSSGNIESSKKKQEIGQGKSTDGGASKKDWKKPKNGTTAIGRYLGTDSDVVFPDVYDGIRIDAIADTTKNVPDNYKAIKTVIIPEGYTIIGKNAFAGCEQLEKIQLPGSLRAVGAGAFTDCKALKEIVFPQNISSFGTALFSGCDLDLVELPRNLEFLPKNCFEGANVDSIVFRGSTLTGSGKVFDYFHEPKVIYTDAKVKIYGITKRVVKPLEELAYRGEIRKKTPAEIKKEWVVSALPDGSLRVEDYKGLDMEITVPDEIAGKAVTELGEGVFDPAKGSSLQSDVKNHIVRVTLPQTIQRIGKGAFRDCFCLKCVELSDNIVEIGEGAFERCKNLETINLPSKLKVIGKMAFSATHSIEACVLPEGLETICRDSFLYGGLTEVHIPDSVSCIGESAFMVSNTKNLVIYGKSGSEAEQYAIGNNVKFVAE